MKIGKTACKRGTQIEAVKRPLSSLGFRCHSLSNLPSVALMEVLLTVLYYVTILLLAGHEVGAKW